ncbi:MAG: hypothetical protein U0031_00045 [Thermomicrobiales bacterium]
MNENRFDGLTRALGGGASRRTVLETVGGAALAVFGVVTLWAGDDAAAKGGKKQKQRRRRCKLTNLRGKRCESTKACCASKDYICGIPFGGAETDPKECCGDLGAPCDFPSDCCAGFTCPTGGGACVEVKEM